MELYIHIPFCVRKCAYCSFVSFPASKAQMDEYVEALVREAEIRKREFAEDVETVYIGGGTPSLLSADQLVRMVRGIEKTVSLRSCREFTIEANPGTLMESFLRTAKELGVNRLSLGMQAKQDSLLRRLGRIHSFQQVMDTVDIAYRVRLDNLNLDLMFGIPFQSAEDWSDTLDAAVSLNPKHISAYGLIPEEGTPLFESLEKKGLQLPDPDEERDMYDQALKKLGDKGYCQYEISNFAKEGFECIHNIGYWTQVPYAGLGLSAASMHIAGKGLNGMTCIRKTNPENINDYYRMIQAKDPALAGSETILPEESRFETMMLSLRMNRGISEKRFTELHGVSLDSCYGSKLRELQGKGLVKKDGNTWSLTRRGMDIQNSILVEFME